jgi:hypothetical protein
MRLLRWIPFVTSEEICARLREDAPVQIRVNADPVREWGEGLTSRWLRYMPLA